jgi:iron complex transport system substrate-binding protein
VNPPRVASLLPSATELVCALGASEVLVARSHACDHPPEVASLPVLTSARFDDGSSREIDDRVKDLLERGLSVYEVDTEQLRDLAPDVILLQDLCKVCAASLDDLQSALASWTGGQPEVVSLSPTTLADVWNDIERVGIALGRETRARELRHALTERVTEIGERSGALARPSVACLEWFEPLMSAGNWVPELVALAGGRNLLAQAGAHSPWLEWEKLAEADPDVVVLMPCGFDLARTRSELKAIRSHPTWLGLRAVREGRVFATDGNAYFNRPGPRLVDSLEVLAELLHPEEFDFGHAGRGFVHIEG